MGIQGRTWPRLGALVAALACVLPAAAGARPGDLPIEVSKPVDGAVVKDATRGLAVDFTCPRYHQLERDDVVAAETVGYAVILASKPDVDEHGLLLVDNRVDTRAVRLLEPATAPANGSAPGALHCTAEEDDAGFGLLPREPGRYWWQAYRTCATYLCPGGADVSDVSAVTVSRTVCTVQRAVLAQARASLATARKQLRRKRTPARRARVARLSERVSELGTRLRVVYACRAS